MNKRVVILIDGSNFYFKLKDLDLQDQLQFDFTKFSNYLSQSDKLVGCVYYIGAVKTDGTKKMDQLHANQQKLFKHLVKHGIRYELGYLLKSNDKFHEKGVDVHMAMDILINAYENRAERIVVVSSDTDLLPAIKHARKLGKDIEYIGFSHLPSNAMMANCSTYQLLTKKEVKKFIIQVRKKIK